MGCVAECVWIEGLSSCSCREFVGHALCHFFADVAVILYTFWSWCLSFDGQLCATLFVLVEPWRPGSAGSSYPVTSKLYASTVLHTANDVHPLYVYEAVVRRGPRLIDFGMVAWAPYVGIVAFTILHPIASFFVLICTPTACIYDRTLFFFLTPRSCRLPPTVGGLILNHVLESDTLLLARELIIGYQTFHDLLIRAGINEVILPSPFGKLFFTLSRWCSLPSLSAGPPN